MSDHIYFKNSFHTRFNLLSKFEKLRHVAKPPVCAKPVFTSQYFRAIEAPFSFCFEFKAGSIWKQDACRGVHSACRPEVNRHGHLCTTAQAGTDPGIFICRSKFPGLKVGRGS